MTEIPRFLRKAAAFATVVVMAPIFHPGLASAQEDIPFNVDDVQKQLNVEHNVDFDTFTATDRPVVVNIFSRCKEDPPSFTIEFSQRGVRPGQKVNFGVVYDLEVSAGVISRRLRVLSETAPKNHDPIYPLRVSTDVGPGWYGLFDDHESQNLGIATIKGVQLKCRQPFPED